MPAKSQNTKFFFLIHLSVSCNLLQCEIFNTRNVSIHSLHVSNAKIMLFISVTCLFSFINTSQGWLIVLLQLDNNCRLSLSSLENHNFLHFAPAIGGNALACTYNIIHTFLRPFISKFLQGPSSKFQQCSRTHFLLSPNNTQYLNQGYPCFKVIFFVAGRQ